MASVWLLNRQKRVINNFRYAISLDQANRQKIPEQTTAIHDGI